MFLDSLKYSFGLDISDLSLKVVSLEQFIFRKKLITRINSFGEHLLPKDVIVNGEIKKPDKFSEILTSLLRHKASKKIRTNVAVVSIPENRTFLKLAPYDSASKDPNAYVKKMIQTYIPEELSKLTYDYQILTEDHNVNVFFGATFNSIANSYFDALDKAHVVPLTFEPETVANCNAIIPINTADDEYNAILDIGSAHSSLSVTSGKNPLLSLTLSFAGDDITNIISKKLNLSLEESEKLKIRCGFDFNLCEISLQKVLSNVIDELKEKLERAFDSMMTEITSKNKTKKIKITHLWLVGGGASFRKLDTVLSKELKMNVKIGDPYVNLGAVKGKFLPENPAKYATAIGLAMVNPKNIPKMYHF